MSKKIDFGAIKKFRKEFKDTKNATRKLVFASELTEDELSDLLDLYEDWKVDEAVSVGDVRRFENKLFKVIQAHTTQGDWTPPSVPALWVAFTPATTEDGNEIIPDFVQPTGAHDSYKKGDRVRFEEKIYESLIDNNAYSPNDYAAGWKLIEG